MRYIALLRGINVGGNNKVSMAQLKAKFEQLGLGNVRTYINSGNVIFTDNTHATQELTQMIERGIHEEFGFAINVVIRDSDSIQAIAAALPDHWTNDAEIKTDVMFLWESVDTPEILNQLSITPDIDEVVYIPGAVLWRVNRKHFSKSGMSTIVGTKLYKLMTIRNCNTVRKLAGLMQE